MLGGLRIALRLARRETLRYKGRSLLSIALLGLPLLGASFGAVVFDTIRLSDTEKAEQFLGGNDAFVQFVAEGTPIHQYTWNDDEPFIDYSDDEPRTVERGDIIAALPPGSRIAPYNRTAGTGTIRVMTADGLADIETLDYDLTDPIYAAANLEYRDGAAPTGDAVALSTAAAAHLGLGAGDTIEVVDGDSTVAHEISGVVELPWHINGEFAIGTVFDGAAAGFLIDTPGRFTYDDGLALNELGLSVWATELVEHPPPVDLPDWYSTSESGTTTMFVGGLIVTVLLIEVVLLAGPAFAISTRRRTREFAIMSAAGATPRNIRDIVLVGGAFFGLVAAVAALVIGILAAWALTPLMEGLFGHRSAGLRVLPWLQALIVGFAVVTGLLTALGAAISASRVNVIAALAGQTPRSRIRKRWTVLGAVFIGLGVIAGFAGLRMWSLPVLSFAIVALQLGIVAATPGIVAAIATIGRWLPLAPRMALREAGRNRGSTAPAIAAVMGVVAGSIALSLTVAADNQRMLDSQLVELPQDTMVLSLFDGRFSEEGLAPEEFDAAFAVAADALDRNLDDLRLHPIEHYSLREGCGDDSSWCSINLIRPDANRCPYWSIDLPEGDRRDAAVAEALADPRCNEVWHRDGSSESVPASLDPAIVAAYSWFDGDDLDAAIKHLRGGGILVSDAFAVDGEGNAVLEVTETSWVDDSDTITEESRRFEFPAMVVDDQLLGAARFYLSPAAADAIGMVPTDDHRRYVVATSTEPDRSVVDAVNLSLHRLTSSGVVEGTVWVTDYTDRLSTAILLGVAGLAGLIALGATAVSTGLILAESRRDMTTLGAVGAAPGLRRRLAMWQTVVIAWLGAGLGTAAGFFGYFLIRAALNRRFGLEYPAEVHYGWELPWAALAVALLAVPLIAALGAAVFTRSGLPSERRLT